jgi:hypothetical protein
MGAESRYRGTKPPTRPRWVKVLLIIAVVLVVALVILAYAGDHGPGRHLPGGDAAGNHAPPVTAER